MDNSFLRLKNSFDDAKNLGESKAIELEYIGQIQLVPGETYLQITNNENGINFSDIKVYLVDSCDNVLEDVSNYVFWTAFTDSNGFKQIAWEFINRWDYNTKPVALKFVEQSNNDTYWTNLFLTTEYRKDFTTRIDYKNNGFHYGTEYDRANYYQSIRLTCYYNNPINESERAEYHQISTDITVPQRNINKQKERFILDEFNYFTMKRLEFLLSSSEIYFDNKRYYSTTPLEYPEREGDSNLVQGDMILNPTDETFTFDYQLYPGLVFERVPEGNYTLGVPLSLVKIKFLIDFNVDYELDIVRLDGGGTTTDTWTWKASRSAAFEVETGTPTGTQGETSAINFKTAFDLDRPSFDTSVSGNEVTIITQSASETFIGFSARDEVGTLLVDGVDYEVSLVDATSGTYPDVLTATFEVFPTLETGTLTVHDASDSSVLATYTESDITLVDNVLSIPSFTGLISTNGEYYINFTEGLVSHIGIPIEPIFNSTDWAWKIGESDYNNNDYSNDYLI